MEMLETNKNFKNTQSAHIYTPRPEFRPLSKFEKRGNRLGHGIWDLKSVAMWQTLPIFNFLASKFKKSCCTIRRLWCFFLCQGSGKNN
jgi:hypothetical protein